MFSFSTSGNGHSVTIYFDGESCGYVSGSDASTLLDYLDECETDADAQAVLEEYAEG